VNRHHVIGLSSGFRKPPLQEFIKRPQVLQPPVLACPHFAQIPSQFHKASIFLGFLALLPGQNLIDFGEHELGSPAIELGQHGGGFLVMKLVKPITLFCSWPPHKSGLDQLLASEA